MDLKNTLVELRQKENKTEQEIQLTAWLEELQMRRELMNFMVKDFEEYKEACIQCQKR